MRTPLYSSGNGDNDTPELNLTPLIDVVFILLIFFLVNHTVSQRKEAKANAAQQSQSKVKKDKAVFYLKGDGSIYNENKLLVENLIEYLGNNYNTEINLIIRPENSVAPSTLILTLQNLQNSGYENIALQEDDK